MTPRRGSYPHRRRGHRERRVPPGCCL